MTATDDRAEIAELLARYAIACDRREFDQVGQCFTEDGQATYSGTRLDPGRAAIVAHLQPLVDVPMTQHVVGSMSITVDGDRATATSYTTVTFVRPAEGGGHEAVHRGLSYDDQLVRTADGWKFQERFHQALWSTSGPTVWPVP
ncbi:MAG: hypothetical protein JWO68_3831 [Actinomycetia bacterium]|nr:hypothetical protein [Actinomycetes bacterium]